MTLASGEGPKPAPLSSAVTQYSTILWADSPPLSLCCGWFHLYFHLYISQCLFLAVSFFSLFLIILFGPPP